MNIDIFAVYVGVILALFLILPLKELKKDYTPIIVTALSVIVLGVAVKRGAAIFEYVRKFDNGNAQGYFEVLYKCFGIAFVTHFISDMCADFGVPSLSGKVEFVGKIGILITTLPLVESLLELSERLL